MHIWLFKNVYKQKQNQPKHIKQTYDLQCHLKTHTQLGRGHTKHTHQASTGEMVHFLPLLSGNHGYRSPGRWMEGWGMDGVILIDLFVDLEGRYRIWLEVQSAEPLVDVALRCTDVDILCVCVCMWTCVWIGQKCTTRQCRVVLVCSLKRSADPVGCTWSTWTDR